MIARVPSLTTAGKDYEVERVGDAVNCECPRYSFSKQCRHIDLVRRADFLLERCYNTHDEPGTGLCRQCLVELLALSVRKVRKGYVPKEVAKQKVAAARKRRVRKQKVKEQG